MSRSDLNCAFSTSTNTRPDTSYNCAPPTAVGMGSGSFFFSSVVPSPSPAPPLGAVLGLGGALRDVGCVSEIPRGIPQVCGGSTTVDNSPIKT